MKVAVLAFAFTVVFAVGNDLLAQSPRSNVGRRLDDFERQADKAVRDSMNREMGARKPTKEELRQAARIKEETREDLEGLQQSYNEIVTGLGSGQPFTADMTRQAASRVNKHANRLMANAVFPKQEPEKESEVPVPAGDVRRQLRDLCTQIYKFLTNPTIENPAVLDLQAAKEAKISLEAVILISGKLSSDR